MALQVALLRGQSAWSNSTSCAVGCGQHADFVGLAAAHEQGGVGRFALAGQARHRLQAGGLGQQAQLFQVASKCGAPKSTPTRTAAVRGAAGAGDNVGCSGTFVAGLLQAKELLAQTGQRQDRLCSDSAVSAAVLKFTARPGTMVEMACL
jgi:hypothetical protein